MLFFFRKKGEDVFYRVEQKNAIYRFKQHDPVLKLIDIRYKNHTDAKMSRLVDCMLAHTNFITRLDMTSNRLTDVTGVKLARYVVVSSIIECMDLKDNLFALATYLAFAEALRINISLRSLFMLNNEAKDKSRIDAAFTETLRVNPVRPADSNWHLYWYDNDFPRLQDEAKELGHPSLQLLLCAQLDHFTFQTTRH